MPEQQPLLQSFHALFGTGVGVCQACLTSMGFAQLTENLQMRVLHSLDSGWLHANLLSPLAFHSIC